MLGPRITTVFRSRWRALWWVLSILLGVWFTIPHGGSDDPDQPSADAVQAAAAILGSPQPATPPTGHANPWAKDGPADRP